jgi:cyclase
MKPVLVAILAIATSRVAQGSSAHQSRAPEPVTGNVVITQIGPDVYAAIRTEPLGLAVNSNSLFIVNDQDVVVVDAQFTRAATLENIAALRRITRKPVRYVINTHWHDDHVAGNQVYRDSFPGVEFIAQINTRADIVALGRPNRAGQVAGAPPAADRFERLLAMGLGGDSTPASPAERVSLTSAINIIRRYVAENAGFHEILPDTVVDRSTTLVRGARTIELHWFGRANTRGDLVTYLPKDRIVSTGDLVVAPIPFGFNSYPSEWIAVLDSVMALKPKVIVPGHGPLMHNLTYVQTVRRMLATARDRTREAAEKGITRDSVLRVVQLDDLRAEVAGDDKWMRTMFGMFFRQPVVSRVFDEVKNGPLK